MPSNLLVSSGMSICVALEHSTITSLCSEVSSVNFVFVLAYEDKVCFAISL